MVPSSAAAAVPASAPPLTRISRDTGRLRISDRVYDELESAIRQLRLPPGAVLSETELSLQLGVSRTPIREAVSRLAEQRLITVVSQVATTVSLIDLAEVEEGCFIRSSLETAAFARACAVQSRSADALRQILAAQELAVARQDTTAFFETDDALHQEIFRLAGVPNVWSLVRGSKSQLDRLRWLYMPEAVASRRVLDDHIRIVDLLERGDAAAGTQLVERHAVEILDLAGRLRAERPEYFTT